MEMGVHPFLSSEGHSGCKCQDPTIPTMVPNSMSMCTAMAPNGLPQCLLVTKGPYSPWDVMEVDLSLRSHCFFPAAVGDSVGAALTHHCCASSTGPSDSPMSGSSGTLPRRGIFRSWHMASAPPVVGGKI